MQHWAKLYENGTKDADQIAIPRPNIVKKFVCPFNTKDMNDQYHQGIFEARREL